MKANRPEDAAAMNSLSQEVDAIRNRPKRSQISANSVPADWHRQMLLEEASKRDNIYKTLNIQQPSAEEVDKLLKKSK